MCDIRKNYTVITMVGGRNDLNLPAGAQSVFTAADAYRREMERLGYKTSIGLIMPPSPSTPQPKTWPQRKIRENNRRQFNRMVLAQRPSKLLGLQYRFYKWVEKKFYSAKGTL